MPVASRLAYRGSVTRRHQEKKRVSQAIKRRKRRKKHMDLGSEFCIQAGWRYPTEREDEKSKKINDDITVVLSGAPATGRSTKREFTDALCFPGVESRRQKKPEWNTQHETARRWEFAERWRSTYHLVQTTYNHLNSRGMGRWIHQLNSVQMNNAQARKPFKEEPPSQYKEHE